MHYNSKNFIIKTKVNKKEVKEKNFNVSKIYKKDKNINKKNIPLKLEINKYLIRKKKIKNLRKFIGNEY